MLTDILRDLGTVSEPVLIFGGPYGNLEATTAVLAEADRRGIPPERIVCTGDVAAYCADARATVDVVRCAGFHTIMGNCEEALAFDGEDCGCGFRPDSPCDLLSRQWFAHARAQLDGDRRNWMATLPRQLRLTMNGRRLAVLHGGATDIGRYVFASTPTAEKKAELERLDVDGVIGGHCGLPFTHVFGGGLWHNAGAVGMPANDGTPKVWFSVIAAIGDDIEISHWPLEYDHATTAAKMRDAGLPIAYARALEDGLWPSMEVLPRAERLHRGEALSPAITLWPATHRGSVGAVRELPVELLPKMPAPSFEAAGPCP